MTKLTLKNNLIRISNEIKLAAPNKNITLLAVTKTHPIETIKNAQLLGIRCFGENKVQEAETKAPHISNSSELHFIGHLQSNKVKKAVQLFDVIQTTHSLKLAEKINIQAKKINKTQRIYCQINIGNDPNKTGFFLEGFHKNIHQIINQPNLSLEGIMTILPINISTQQTKNLYVQTRKITNNIEKKYNLDSQISMGMSNDYLLAIECGATIIRIGTKLFGKRP